jgi:hypothetical protein
MESIENIEQPIVEFKSSNLRKFEGKTGDVIITAAQNNTEPHKQALASLEMYAGKVGAELLIMPIKYNKSAFSKQVEDEHENYHHDINPYLVKDNICINDIFIYAGCSILPTAKYPVNAGIDLNEGERITIVSSPKMQQKEMPRGEGQDRSTVYTTGCITLPNYINARAGAVAQKQHKIAALYIQDGKVYPLEYSDQLGWDYEFKTAVLGDLHCESMDNAAFTKTLDMLSFHSIKTVVLHDVLDFQNRNGHERNNPLHLYRQQKRSVLDDIAEVHKVFKVLTDTVKNVYIVRSNHDDMLERWLSDTAYQPHLDPVNAKLYHELKAAQLDLIDNGTEQPNMLEFALEHYFSALHGVKFLALGDSLNLHGVCVNNHGHKGVNGARSGLQKLNRPMVVGHSHSGQRLDDFITVGTLANLKQGYNQGGGSTWTHHNALICKSGRIVLSDVSNY